MRHLLFIFDYGLLLLPLFLRSIQSLKMRYNSIEANNPVVKYDPYSNTSDAISNIVSTSFTISFLICYHTHCIYAYYFFLLMLTYAYVFLCLLIFWITFSLGKDTAHFLFRRRVDFEPLSPKPPNPTAPMGYAPLGATWVKCSWGSSRNKLFFTA